MLPLPMQATPDQSPWGSGATAVITPAAKSMADRLARIREKAARLYPVLKLSRAAAFVSNAVQVGTYGNEA